MLPEKWCILRTKKNFIKINNYFNLIENNKKRYSFMDSNNYLTSDHINAEKWASPSNKTGKYTEISFEDFRRYVLKENVETTYEIY